jgi:hypothetical protein
VLPCFVDQQVYLTQLKELEDVEEVHFGANSLGVEACEAIAEVLKEKKTSRRPWTRAQWLVLPCFVDQQVRMKR